MALRAFARNEHFMYCCVALCDLNHHCYKDSEKVDADFKMMEAI